MKKTIQKILPALLAIALCSIPSAVEAENGMPDIDPNQPLVLTIDFGKENDQGVRYGISGATFAVYKAASLTVENGNTVYTVASPYQSLAVYENGEDVTFHDMSSTAYLELAESFAAIDSEPLAEGVTDSNGKAVLTVTEPGIYLVEETGAEGAAADYKLTDPTFVALPQKANLSWLYTMTVYPKTTAKTSVPTPTPETTPTPEVTPAPTPTTHTTLNRLPVTTGVENNTAAAALVLISALFLVFICILLKQNRKEE